MNEIQPADYKARRKAMWLVVTSSLIGIGVILTFEYFKDDLSAWLELNIDYLIHNSEIVFLAALALVTPILGAGVYLLFYAKRIIRFQRFPPPNQVVYRDTPLLRGDAAIRRGRLLQLLSWLLMIATGAIPFVLWGIFHALGEGPL